MYNDHHVLATQSSNGKFYCGRFGLLHCRCCDGRCGPDNGCNCPSCSRLDRAFNSFNTQHTTVAEVAMLNGDGVPAKRGTSGKYYCGRRGVLSCYCCNGTCGPTSGCNCHSCHVLDDPILYRNTDGVPCHKVNGRFYCGRRNVSCRCCDGYCGPTSGCSCRACQMTNEFSAPRIIKSQPEIPPPFVPSPLPTTISVTFNAPPTPFVPSTTYSTVSQPARLGSLLPDVLRNPPPPFNMSASTPFPITNSATNQHQAQHPPQQLRTIDFTAGLSSPVILKPAGMAPLTSPLSASCPQMPSMPASFGHSDTPLPPTSTPMAASTTAIETPPSTLNNEPECVICFSEPKSHAFIPCGHKCVCKACADAVIAKNRECPMCRRTASLIVQIFD